MHTLDAKVNINHCHLGSYNSVVRLYIIFFTSSYVLDTYNTEF